MKWVEKMEGGGRGGGGETETKIREGNFSGTVPCLCFVEHGTAADTARMGGQEYHY